MSNSYLASRLSARDQAIIDMLQDLRLLRSDQITRLAFNDGNPLNRPRRQRKVMQRLVNWGAAHRFPRPIGGASWGSGPACYTVPTFSNQGVSKRQHTLDIAELYVRLIEAHRAGQIELVNFLPEPYCHVQIGKAVYEPDGKIHVRTSSGEYLWFLEIDESHEWTTKLKQKMTRAQKVWERWPKTGNAVKDTFPRGLYVVKDQKRYDFVKGIIDKQPEDLFDVCLFEDAVGRLAA